MDVIELKPVCKKGAAMGKARGTRFPGYRSAGKKGLSEDTDGMFQ